jgi:hypothetical protein
MLGANLRQILNTISSIGRAPAEIHVLEPHWMKSFVKAAQMFPYISPRQKECARRLLHRTFAIQIPIQISIAAIDGIARPEAVDSQKLESKGSRCRKSANGEPTLALAPGAHQLSRRQTVFPACLDQRSDIAPQPHIGVQQKNRVRAGQFEALVRSSGEPAILPVRHQLHTGPPADLFHRPIRRTVVDYGRSHPRS